MQNKDTKTYWNRRLEGSKMDKTVVPSNAKENAMEHRSLAGFVPDGFVPSGGFSQSQATFAFSILSFGSETMF